MSLSLYYIPPGSGLELRKAQQETERLLLAIGNLKDRMPDQKSVEEMEKLMRELEAQVKALQGRVNILTSENEGLRGQVNQLTAEKDHLRTQVNQLTAEKQQLQTQVDQLMTEKQQLVARNQELETKNKELIAANEELTNRLNRRRPFLLVARTADFSQDVDVMVKYKTTSEESGPVPDKMFTAWLNGEFDVINQIRAAYLSGRGIALNMVTEVAGGATLKAYVRLATVSTRRAATEINSALFGNTAGMPPTRLPKVTLTPERFWIFLGTIRLNDNYEPVFQEATAEERDAEWKALTSSTPPPTPTPTPTPTEAERAAAEAQRAKYEAQRIKIQEARKKFTKLMQIPLDDAGKNDAEILQLADEILKDLPPRDFMYREVQSRRDRVLEMKARREGRTPPPNNRTSPPSPPARQPAPAPSLTP